MQKGGGDPIELNFEGQMQKCNTPTDRAQRVDEKIRSFVFMFTHGVVAIKMSKMAHFLYFLVMAAKN